MDKFFGSVFNNGATAEYFFLCLGVAIATGVAFAFLCRFATRSSKSFFVSAALLPVTVAMVIMLVNGNVGVGVAVAGAFSLVRFRSAPGTAKEICIIFVAMASGLAFGMGYLAYGALFAVIAAGVLIVCAHLKIPENKTDIKEKKLTVTIPEDLDYTSVFDDILKSYTQKYELVKVKSVNMGSMFRVTYAVTLKDLSTEKEFIDQLRCRNGNLEISLERVDFQATDL